MTALNDMDKNRLHPYLVILSLFVVFAVFAFAVQKPSEILDGLISIVYTRGVLITDYMKIAGIGAALMNGVLIGTITVFSFIGLKIVPTGSTIMAIFLTVGFSMFGKNILTMIPITFGVWLYSKLQRKPFADYYIVALLAATVSPITSEIIFLEIYTPIINAMLGIMLGTLAGFLFPMISVHTFKIHAGYHLYNLGFVGGLLATFFTAFLTGMGIEVKPEYYVSGGNNIVLGALMYSVSAVLIICGVILNRKSIEEMFKDLALIMKQTGRLPSDFFTEYGTVVYINMGLLCALGTSLILILGADLNGPTIAGILTMTGFGAFGKHLRNVIPVIIGAIIATQINKWDASYPTNVLAILFCSGLAPIAGKYGVFWGMFAGFVHVCFSHHIGFLSCGLNLYSNGFAAGFAVILMIPIIKGINGIFKHNPSKI